MKTLTNSSRIVVTQRREQIDQHVGPAGLRSFTRDIAEYEVPASDGDTAGGVPWKASFVAGDLLSVVAGQPGGGPLEIAILDDHQQPLVLSKCPGGLCRAGARVPRSGVYAVHVRAIRPARPAGDAPDPTTSSPSGPVPFKLSRTRQMPRPMRARMAPRRRRVRPRYVTSPTRRVLGQVVTRICALYERLSRRAHPGAPAAA